MERDVDEDLELVELQDGAVIQENEPGAFVWALEDGAIVELRDQI